MRRPKAVEYVCVCRRSMKRLSGLFPSSFLPCCYWLAKRWLGLGLCLTDRLGRPCFSFPSDCRGRQRSFVLASEVRRESKPLPLVDTLYTYQRNKNVLETRGHDRHLFALGVPGNSQLVYILLHCTTWGKITELPLAL